MENIERHIATQDHFIKKIIIVLKGTIMASSKVFRRFLHFCLLHWKEIALNIYGAIMMALCLFVAQNKLLNFDQNLEGMLRQPFSKPMAIFLAYAVPGSELFAGLLIAYRRTRLIGLGFCSLLMIAFTIYVGTAILYLWSDSLPCNCGLILQIGWKQHFMLNLFLTLISCWAFVLQWWTLKTGNTDQGKTIKYHTPIGRSIPALRNISGKSAENGWKWNHKHTKE
jgi:hypothetical protein